MGHTTLGSRLGFQPTTSRSSNMEPANSPVTQKPATPPRSGMESHSNLYNNRRPPSSLKISHKSHSHIAASKKTEILAIDQEIKAAFDRQDRESFIAKKLTDLLDKPYFQSTDSQPDSARGSAQKMALETFKQAFPLTISDDKNHLELLKKLIDVLPNLDHNRVVERDPQRRGLHVLEDALGKLKPDEAAEVLAHLMNRLGDLSQKLSKHKAVNVPFEGFALSLMGLGTTGACVGGFVVGNAGAVTAAAALGPFGVVVPLIAAGVTVAHMKSIQKQPQGTALYMLKDQLAKLRKNWGDVTPDNQQQLTEAFKNLQSSYDEHFGIKTSTLQRFFNDSFIDPSKFDAEPKQGKELRKMLQHKFITPITSRLKSVPTSTIKAIKGDVMKDRELKPMLLGMTITPSLENKEAAINHLMEQRPLTGKIRGNPDFERHVAPSADRVAAEDKFLRTTMGVLIDEAYHRRQRSINGIKNNVMNDGNLKGAVLNVVRNSTIRNKEQAIISLSQNRRLTEKITNNRAFQYYVDRAPSAERVAAKESFLQEIIKNLVEESYRSASFY